ncbi:MAG: ribosome biogenesis GTPase YlqF [Eubacteriales bacterium]|nr:ribosome biogenesis GTPase YlqF [Eubacteriales bacterium]
MNLNWYPGHMAKSFRLLKTELQRVQLVIECCDARIPLASRNPKIRELCGNKDRVLLLTKSDLAAPEMTKEWLEALKAEGEDCLAIDLKSKQALKEVERLIKPYRDKLAARDKQRGRRPRPLTIACLGIPNVGKSTLGNLLLGRSSHATENRPGLTRSITFITSRNKRYELMDSPGLLWPKLETKLAQVQLAICMAIPDSLIPLEELALDFLLIWNQLAPDSFKDFFTVEKVTNYEEARQALEEYALKQQLLAKGGEADYLRAAERLLQQYRQGRLTELSLERPGIELNLAE